MNLASYRPSKGLVGFLCVLLTLNALLSLVGAGSSWLDIELLGKYSSFDQISNPELIAAGLRAIIVGGSGIIVFLLTVVVFCVWVVRAAKNARALGAEGMAISPGWCAGWFFVPFANLVMPFKGVSEIYRASEPNVAASRGLAWQGVPLPGVLAAWWALWIISSVLGNASFTIGSSDSITSMTNSAWLTIMSQLLSMGCAFCAISVIKLIQMRQQMRAEAIGEDPSLANTEPMAQSFIPHAPAA